MSSVGDFVVETAKNGRRKCQRSKESISKGDLCIGKVGPNPFKEDALSTKWYKVDPFFELQLKQRKTTAKMESVEQLIGFNDIDSDNQAIINAALGKYLVDKDAPKPKKKAKKRKAKTEEGVGDSESKGVRSKSEFTGEKKSPKKAKKVKKAKEESKVDLSSFFSGVSGTCSPKDASAALKKVAKELGFPLPEDEMNASIRCGQMLMGNKTDGKFDFVLALKALAQELGCPEKVPGATKVKKKRTAPEANCPDNQELVDAFWDMAGFEFKQRSNKMKGIGLQKVARALAGIDWKVASGKEVSQGKKKLAGVGKSSGAKITEFLETGKIERLERFKKGDFE